MSLTEAFHLALSAALPVDPFGGIPVDWLDNVGIVGLVVLVGVGIARGWIVTRREADGIAHDRDQWRAESRIKDQTIADLTEQNNTLLREIAPSMNQMFGALRKVGAEARDVDR